MATLRGQHQMAAAVMKTAVDWMHAPAVEGMHTFAVMKAAAMEAAAEGMHTPAPGIPDE